MTTYYSSSSVFLAKKTPSVVNNCRESTAPKSRQTAKIGFLLLSSDGLVQIWLTPSRRCFTKQQHFTLSSARPHRFLTTSKSHEALETAHSITMASCATPFSLYVRIRRATLNFELKLCTVCGVNGYQVCCYKNEVNKCKKHKKCMEM